MPEEERLQSDFFKSYDYGTIIFFFFLHTHGMPFVYTGKKGKHRFVKIIGLLNNETQPSALHLKLTTIKMPHLSRTSRLAYFIVILPH